MIVGTHLKPDKKPTQIVSDSLHINPMADICAGGGSGLPKPCCSLWAQCSCLSRGHGCCQRPPPLLSLSSRPQVPEHNPSLTTALLACHHQQSGAQLSCSHCVESNGLALQKGGKKKPQVLLYSSAGDGTVTWGLAYRAFVVLCVWGCPIDSSLRCSLWPETFHFPPEWAPFRERLGSGFALKSKMVHCRHRGHIL